MKRIGSALGSLSVAVLSVVLIPVSASAASNSIGITPRNDFTVNPGDTVKGKIVVKDLDSKTPLNASIQILDFKAAGQTGEPALLLTETTPTKWSLKPYLTIQDSVTVKPGASTDVPFSITIPENMGGASLYSAVRFSSGANQESGNVGLSSSAVSLIFVNVKGKATHSLTLQKFGAFVPTPDFKDGTYQTFFGSTKPKYLSYTLKNNGNIAEEPIGSIQVTGPFGKQYKMIQNLNPNHNLVLIDQTRRIDVCIQEPAGTKQDNTEDSVENISQCKDPSLTPGRYTAKIDLLYGDQTNASTEIRAIATFWYLPAWFIIAIVVVLLVLVGVIWLIINAIKNGRGTKFRIRR